MDFSDKDEDLDILHRKMFDAWELVVNSNSFSNSMYHQLGAIFAYEEESDESSDDCESHSKGKKATLKETMYAKSDVGTKLDETHIKG
jgi:hypothetical protein